MKKIISVTLVILVLIMVAMIPLKAEAVSADGKVSTWAKVKQSDTVQAQLAPAVTLTETQINQLILSKAASQNGWKFDSVEGQCKKWVQNVVYGSTKKSLPQNDPCVYYQWLSSPAVKIVWQVRFACISSFSSNLKAGQIMQIQWLPTYMKGERHTFIIKSISSSSISYWECNGWAGKYTVGYHTESINDWGRHAAAWTTYQVLP